MSGQRDYSIDFFKGITVISIIYIHTVWWSGTSYVPGIIQQLSLLVDVPLFFFLSGASATFSFKKKRPFSGIARLIMLFSLFYLIYAFCFKSSRTFEFFIQSLFLYYPKTKVLPVVSASTWFIRVFVIVYIIAYLIILHLGEKNIIVLILVLLISLMNYYESFAFFESFTIFSISPDFIFTYLFFFLLGYYYYKYLRELKYINWISIGLFLASTICIAFHFYDEEFNLQQIKFPPRFHYLIISLISVCVTIYFSKFIRRYYLINYFGINALQFYLAQGISSSLLFFILPNLNTIWQFKLIIAFVFNLISATLITIVIVYLFKHFLKLSNKILIWLDDLHL